MRGLEENGSNRKDKEGGGGHGTGWVTGSGKVDTRQGKKREDGEAHRMQSRTRSRSSQGGGSGCGERKSHPEMNAIVNKDKVSLRIYLDAQEERNRCPARDTQCAG